MHLVGLHKGIKTIQWNEKEIHSADEELGKIIKEYEIEKAVIGLPKNMNGTIGERGEASQDMQHILKNFINFPLYFGMKD